MILAKKDTPKQYWAMWYSGLLNLSLCYFNLTLYILRGNIFDLILSIVILVLAIGMFLLIKRLVRKQLWDKLTRHERRHTAT